MYKILWRSNDQILHEKVLDDGVAQELIDAHNHLNKNIRCLDFYYIVKKDLSDFIDYMKNQQDSAENPDGVETNRLLYNFTNALYSYIEYLEKNFKTAFSIVKKEIYDTQFSYRLMYEMVFPYQSKFPPYSIFCIMIKEKARAYKLTERQTPFF